MAPAQEVLQPRSPPEGDNVHYTVLIRLPFPRGDFIDPPTVSRVLDAPECSIC